MGIQAKEWRKAFVIASLSVAPLLAASVTAERPLKTLAGLPSAPVAMAFTMRNLVIGSQGYDVYELQNRLRYIGYYKGKIDGKFGWQTYFAVRHFQQRFGMQVTGKVDFKTKQVLVKASKGWHFKGSTQGTRQTGTSSGTRGSAAAASAIQTVPGITKSDINLMAHVVNGEARGEPYRGQVAIAAVILNRMKDPRFPHSIPQIIYHPGSFTCVSDGQINLSPDPSAYKAVEAAIHGWDPSHGAVYYFDPATATNKWIWSRPEIITIGHHIFCR